ncbi:hypothetical protein LCGC14_0263210 [marine sediment metagenome]|uniref:Uncharacterized protein n=1 Tax=marine sediment metagenome TaxID=412755 RepID=A0A0F9WLW6_9ZZZZ
MGEIIARFADGRLLVQEDKAAEIGTISGGHLFFRVGHIGTIERVLSIDASMSGHSGEKVAIELRDVAISGDTLRLQLRRMDIGLITLTSAQLATTGGISGAQGIWSGVPLASGGLSLDRLSGVTSGLNYYSPVVSTALISGILRIMANVIGY